MAVYNEILVGRFNRALQKLMGLKGPPPTPQLSSEVMPTHGFFNGVENRYLESWNRFMFGDGLPASVGNINGVRLRNPASSNVMVVLEKLMFNNQGAAANGLVMSFGSTGADLTTPFGQIGARLDSRGNPNPVLAASSQQSAAITDLTMSFNVGTLAVSAFYDWIITDDQEITILPGDAIQIRTNTVNLATAFSWQWRERFLEDSERA